MGEGLIQGSQKTSCWSHNSFFLRSWETSGPGGWYASSVLGFLQLLSSSSNKGYSPCLTLLVSSDHDSCSSDANARLLSCDHSGSALPGPLSPLLLPKGRKNILLGSKVASPEGEQEGCANLLGCDAGQSHVTSGCKTEGL